MYKNYVNKVYGAHKLIKFHFDIKCCAIVTGFSGNHFDYCNPFVLVHYFVEK